jgi:hypothetical protein
MEKDKRAMGSLLRGAWLLLKEYLGFLFVQQAQAPDSTLSQDVQEKKGIFR